MKIINDIRNFFFIRRTILNNKDTPEWKKYGLTYDWLYRLGVVINMRQEDFGEPTEVHQARFSDFVKPIFFYLGEKLGLGELIKPTRYRINNSYSYFIKFTHLYEVLSWKYILISLGILITAIYIILRFLNI